MVISFPSDVTDSKATSIAQEWCEEMFESRNHGDDVWDYYAALHTDTAHPHVHIVVNNRGTERGQWFYMARDGDFNYQLMRDAIVDIADDHDVLLDSASRLERGKLTYELPTHLHQMGKRSGLEVLEKPLPEPLLADSEDIRARYIFETESMAEVADVMDLKMMHDVLARAAVDLRGGKAVDVKAYFAEEEFIELNLDQPPSDLRETILQWSADNAERIAKADPVKRDDFVRSWVGTLDLLDACLGRETPPAYTELADQERKHAVYNGALPCHPKPSDRRPMARPRLKRRKASSVAQVASLRLVWLCSSCWACAQAHPRKWYTRAQASFGTPTTAPMPPRASSISCARSHAANAAMPTSPSI